MYNKMFAIKKHFILLWDYVRCKNWNLFLIGKSWYLYMNIIIIYVYYLVYN